MQTPTRHPSVSSPSCATRLPDSNVINHALFEISFVIREQTDAGRGLFDNGLVAHADGTHEIPHQESHHARFIRFGDAGLFSKASRFLALGAVRDAAADNQMPTAKHSETENAQT